MDRRIVIAAAAALLAALAMPGGASGGAQGITVEAGDANRFSPKVGSWVLISSNFGWIWGDGGDGGVSERRHNVVQDRGLFRSGDPVKTAPGAGDYFQLSASAGTFPYFCQLHGGRGGEGMSGKIRVPPSEGPPEPDGVPILWAVDASTTGSRYAVRFKVENGNWRTWKGRTRAQDDIFGRDDDPVNFNGTKTYKIQARSQKQDPAKHSGWSPSLVIP
jgi:hypothetical protein